MNPDTAAFFIRERRRPLSRKRIWGAVRSYGELAGLPLRAHPHMLRHACGYALADQGADTRLIKGGKPPALPGDFQSLTVPGILGCFAQRTAQSSRRATNSRAVIPAALLGRNPDFGDSFGSKALDPGLKPAGVTYLTSKPAGNVNRACAS